MAETADRLLAEYRARFLDGERPDVLDYLARAGDQQERLADLLDDFLMHAPPVDPRPEDLAAVQAIIAGEPTLAAQRSARGIRRKAVVDAIMAAFGLKIRSRVEQRYHELESGLIDPRGADPRLIDVVASALGVARAALVLARPPQVDASTAFLREAPPPVAGSGARMRLPLSPRPATAAGPPPRRSEEAERIDRLFGVEP
jgi:AcrR family transcriptional regulator